MLVPKQVTKYGVATKSHSSWEATVRSGNQGTRVTAGATELGLEIVLGR